MTTKQEARAKISAAEVACGEVQEKWKAATQALGGSMGVNGFGIYHNRFALKSKLLEAQARIGEALQALEAVDWPTNADYDQF